MVGRLLCVIATFLLLVCAQTITTTDANGHTIIQVITAINGVPTTQVLQTLSPTSSPSPQVAATTVPQGPVGQPAPTTGTPGGPTPYTYTTVISGVTTTVVDIFTPTSPATVPVVAPASGTILNYSSWLSIYGPPPTSAKSAGVSLRPGSVLMLLLPTLLWNFRR